MSGRFRDGKNQRGRDGNIQRGEILSREDSERGIFREGKIQ